ncbi:fatty acid-binding protein, brain [Folsomia candida]|uniref:Fatty acid-binding protein, muscle n=1 Tax=Folsomia candida TaxID=158441 RepID=A0A226DW15_FOLCA|nr:fatty acid-binding protein, brain [Folsomia candida]OXA49228.1 Fatty acid-binding protein, brain [Folsomia candida]
MVSIAGKYEFVSSDNYDEFMKACGVSLVTRTVANKLKNQVEFKDLGNNKWNQKTFSTFKDFEITFTLGESFEEQTADGRKCQAIVTREGDTLIHKQQLEGIETVVTREFKPNGELVCTFKAKDAVAKRVYKKV